ncbi:MAG: 30S ribosomal protein S8 [Patescibacteria group bacterium]|jgi:small subunit ribosomal protein S8
MLSDPIADMLTRIRNGYMAQKESIIVPHSKFKEEIAKVLTANRFLKEVTVEEEDKKKFLVIDLLYVNGKPAVTAVEKISKAGRRMYRGRKKLPYVLSGLGKAIISTSKGVMTAEEARKQSLGGEVICQIY